MNGMVSRMVYGYNREVGLQKYASKEEAIQEMRRDTLIFDEGYTYLHLEREEGMNIIVKYVDNETGTIIPGEYAWKMGNSFLQSQIQPHLHRILNTRSKNNKFLRVRYDGGKIVSVEQRMSRRGNTNYWEDIREDIKGIFKNGNGYLYKYKRQSIASSSDLKTIKRIKHYFKQKKHPSWMRLDGRMSTDCHERLCDLFSQSRKWDDDFDREVKELYDTANRECTRKNKCVQKELEQYINTVKHIELRHDCGCEKADASESSDECDLIVRVLQDLHELDSTSFRHHLDFGNLKQELSRVYGEKQIQKIIGGTL